MAPGIVERISLKSASLYATNAARILVRERPRPSLRTEERLLFVVGSPRSGTSFLARSLGEQPGLVDLGEVKPLKAIIPGLVTLGEDEAARVIRRTLETVRTLALARGARGVEQTPETSHVLGAALRAYPAATAVHIVRDGRDVVCSLLDRGWFDPARGDIDDAGLPYGASPRFWVEPQRADEFRRVSDARRAAWAWRRYVTSARSEPERTVELRYEELVSNPAPVAARLAAELDLDPVPLTASLTKGFDTSVGRWKRDLTQEQLEDVEAEAGPLLRELNYE